MKQPTSSDRRSFLKAGGAVAAGPYDQRCRVRASRNRLPSSSPRECQYAGRHANPQPRQDGLQGGNLQPWRTGCARKAQQLRRGGAHHRACARPRRQLHRYLIDLRRSSALERAVRRPRDEDASPGCVSRHQDERTHARRLIAHDRKVSRPSEYRSHRLVAVA